MALLIAIFIEGLFLFIGGEFVAKVLPKTWKPYRIMRGLVFSYIGLKLFSCGVFGVWLPPAPQTVPKLVEQARGDELYWNNFGKTTTQWEQYNHRHYQRSCQTYALEQLAKLGPAASPAVPELIKLFNEIGAYNTGDGVYLLRSQNAKTLGAIGHPDAIEPLIGMLLSKSLSPDDHCSSKIGWHYDGPYQENRGTGPQGILMGLMLMPSEYHAEILEKLKIVRAKIEQSELLNDWSKFEIDRGIRFFESNKEVKARVRRYVSGAWDLQDHATLEKLLDPEYVRPRIQTRTMLRNGQWKKEVSTPEEQQEILVLEKRLKKMGFTPSVIEKEGPVIFKYRVVDGGTVKIASVGWRPAKK